MFRIIKTAPIVLLLILLMNCNNKDSKSVTPNTSEKHKYTITANKGGINIRTGPGTNFAIDPSGQIVKGETLYILEEKDGWIRFRITTTDIGWSGWILKRLLANNNECEKFVELLSAEVWSKETGWSIQYVLANHRINIWQKESSQGKGRYVGELIPGSRAQVIAEGKDDYKIKSPLDGAIGWISKIQVARTLKQNINTYEECE